MTNTTVNPSTIPCGYDPANPHPADHHVMVINRHGKEAEYVEMCNRHFETIGRELAKKGATLRIDGTYVQSFATPSV